MVEDAVGQSSICIKMGLDFPVNVGAFGGELKKEA